MSKITKVTVRMYRMGTGDCFILKFYAGDKEECKMMIDCGTWSGSGAALEKYITDIKKYVDNHVHILVVTHEHKDHVHGFDVCEKLLTGDFYADRVWMAWTENDKSAKVKKWKKEYGDKKKALALAAQKLGKAINDPQYKKALQANLNGKTIYGARERFSLAVNELNEIQNNMKGGTYVGPLAGMEVVKKKMPKGGIEYFNPGDIIENIAALTGVRFYVLGPPTSWENGVKVESGGKGETYDHNKKLEESEAFAAAVLNKGKNGNDVLPFDREYILTKQKSPVRLNYNNAENDWRKIDVDWLYSAGSLALRMNSITNNLSLALAIEFEDSGKVMLFPGDAEYGSWASWHTIPWDVPCRNGKEHFTEDLLSRTVFYKVAHHLSHNGTAQRLGMDMMTHPDLVAMATLDYNTISPNWKNTMPNRAILNQLIAKTKGRLLIMEEKGLFYDFEEKVPLKKKLEEAQSKMTKKEKASFKSNALRKPLYIEYGLEVG